VKAEESVSMRHGHTFFAKKGLEKLRLRHTKHALRRKVELAEACETERWRSGYTDVLGPEDGSLSYLPRLPAASHDFLLPPTTFCRLLRLPAASHNSLVATAWRNT
jgi:hypothetical protein